jgi:hypothetical protein
LGIEVADARLVAVKTPSNFGLFPRWCRHLIRVDRPGTTQSDLSRFRWQQLPRLIDPFEEVTEWRPDSQVQAAPGCCPSGGTR